MISNCGPQYRLDYLQKLMNAGVKVDSYGACLNNKEVAITHQPHQPHTPHAHLPSHVALRTPSVPGSPPHLFFFSLVWLQKDPGHSGRHQPTKLDVIAHYKFVFSFENSHTGIIHSYNCNHTTTTTQPQPQPQPTTCTSTTTSTTITVTCTFTLTLFSLQMIM